MAQRIPNKIEAIISRGKSFVKPFNILPLIVKCPDSRYPIANGMMVQFKINDPQ